MNYKSKYSICVFVIWVLVVLLGYQIKMANHLQNPVKYRFENHIDRVALKAMQKGEWRIVFEKGFTLPTRYPFKDRFGLDEEQQRLMNLAFNRGMWDSVEWESSSRPNY